MRWPNLICALIMAFMAGVDIMRGYYGSMGVNFILMALNVAFVAKKPLDNPGPPA